MATRTRARKDAPSPAAQAVAEATADVPVDQLTDEQIMERIKAVQAERDAGIPQPPRQRPLSDIFEQAVALLAGALGYKTAKLRSETNAVKVFELTLMWALNQQQRGQNADLLPSEMLGSGSDEPEVPSAPVPNEIIEAAPDEDAAPESE